MRSLATAEILPPAPMTLDEWADMDEDEPGELVDGHLEDEEVPDNLHEAVAAWLFRMLGVWGAERRAAVFGAEHKLGVSKTRGRKPDVSMYAPGTRLGRGSLSRTAPLLVVEVLSPRPRDVRRDRLDKRSEYARFGVKLYLLVDPEARVLELYELGADGRYVLDAAVSEGKLRLPGCEGLELDLDALWAEVAWIVGEEPEEQEAREAATEGDDDVV
ncbi:Uma2 family endonuclease [Polyangium sp. 15x6]|uniref:Uma2 family endonuclease n=1 Tax=Polyangium sp. 15x6 TaxID=3042687 RepID=UPI00249CBCA8|nr:Uma2 family endonuclease [Polyangium sp. 15x6]MDI3282843.1 Uma2 family endonuclease [Polyangium sp. 15x6]